jgi:hypothetical protein
MAVAQGRTNPTFGKRAQRADSISACKAKKRVNRGVADTAILQADPWLDYSVRISR